MNRTPPRLPSGGAPTIPLRPTKTTQDKVQQAVRRLLDMAKRAEDGKAYGEIEIIIKFEAGNATTVDTHVRTVDK